MQNSLLSLVCCIFAALHGAATAFAASNSALELQPVRLHFDAEGHVSAAFVQGCDRRFAGFVYRATPAGELEVGVLIRRAHARCLGLTGMSQQLLPLVRAQDFAAISSLNPSLEARTVTLTPMQNIHRTRSHLRETLHAVYTSLCGTPIGLVIQPQASQLDVGLLESRRLHREPCQRTTAVYSVAGLRLEQLGQTGLIASEKDPLPSYSLRRTPVQLQALVTATGTQAFKLRYRRACNEAPIGLVQRDEAGHRSVSMLVAHYDTMKCPSHAPQTFWSPWHELLHAPAHLAIFTVRADQEEKLRIVRPLAYKILAREGASRLEIKTISSCQRDLGLVSRSAAAGLALGILQTSATPSCNSPLKRVTYQFEVDLRPQAQIKPLQLVGS